MHNPRVSVGMPVYNGEQFLPEAIESIRSQTFKDLEIILCDNASTDGTSKICQSYAARDPRIRYVRNHHNLGAGYNHRRVADLARGEYFKWQSRDDVCDRSFIERCVAVLDRDPSVVLCHSLTRFLNEAGEITGDYKRRLKTDQERADLRFRELIWHDHKCFQIYGLMRTQVMRRVGGMPCCVGGDDILLARLALAGKLYEIPEYLFFSRQHGAQSGRTLPLHFGLRRKRLFPNAVGNLPPLDWWDPSKAGKVAFPEATLLRHYVTAVMAAKPLSALECALSLLWLLPWTAKHAPRFVDDLKIAADVIATSFMRTTERAPFSNRGGSLE